MLVLTRREAPNNDGIDEIRIGDDIVIKVVAVQGQKVRIGVSAPKDVAVVRGELTAFPPVPCLSKELKAWERFGERARG